MFRLYWLLRTATLFALCVRCFGCVVLMGCCVGDLLRMVYALVASVVIVVDFAFRV